MESRSTGTELLIRGLVAHWMSRRAMTQGKVATLVLATGPVVKTGQWRRVMSVIFKTLSLQYLWPI